MMASDLQRIVLVEDETDIQKIARIALEAVGGFSVDVCGSGAEAVELVATSAPDLILLDVMMPGMDGLETFNALRELPTDTPPVIFMTAKVQPHEVVHYKEIGALDVIVKPFDPMTLAATIREIWAKQDGTG